ncbi:MAG: epoxyqueuosine reductase, partial [Flavitalea sp.]
MNTLQEHTSLIKNTATKLGFDYCGIARAQRLDDDAVRLENWLRSGMHGNMLYMEKYFDLRIDPTQLIPGARSVITLLKNYYPSQQQDGSSPRISKYAFGKDYHEVISKQLTELLNIVKEKTGEINGRGFVDSAP